MVQRRVPEAAKTFKQRMDRIRREGAKGKASGASSSQNLGRDEAWAGVIGVKMLE